MKSKNPRLSAAEDKHYKAEAYAAVTAAHAKAAVMAIHDSDDDFMMAAHRKFEDVLVDHADRAEAAARTAAAQYRKLKTK